MCRFLVYTGRDEILLSKLILDPAHSILTQSFDCRLRLDHRRPHNGDGFGVGYYTQPALGSEPCIFTSTIPAWNCLNLERLASKTTSSLIFAHVRATTEGNLSDQNCHPFRYGSLMFMHNGGIGGWRHIKRKLAESVGDDWYNCVQGSTDSEWAFAVLLDSMDRMGYSPNVEPGPEGYGHTVLRKAVLRTIQRINEMTAQVEGDDTRSLLNFAITDGHSVVCSRYVSSGTDEAASLFFSSGTSWKRQQSQEFPDGEKGDYKMERRDKGGDIVLVASEPLTFERDNWVTVPTNSTLTIHKQTVMIHPIIDEFYNQNPSHARSHQFAQTKGQTIADKDIVSEQNGQPDRAMAEPQDIRVA
ncbi:N-terminal nucleophile aminohydrolase [Eremomyces bilateralis CBS 781.70]|uniref:N-terminal nucleophile aminohydrolase n=1 Tax=Eremomyces bilateralis CBS 781.70 TaxID=1392243 RepID=A0A6G1GAW7_9PEZI|nr:N-terminal nucleophile aminohydrolase [Eremomyces bilateralis CBS 781.70]KAF1815228.1 N-terminal nucleophile aminohydrolase [Eremomyces bilateralis CBS 781.70]